MIEITSVRQKRFLKNFLEAGSAIGLADVGSGGKLKFPWENLPIKWLHKIDFEPCTSDLPVCVSDKVGRADFFVAHDERASSLHEANLAFVERFAQESMLPKNILSVQCTTLDSTLEGRYDIVDALDINVEGHDFQVLKGAERLLKDGFIKLLKIEFEIALAWDKQGWFSDIEAFLRGMGFDLVNIEIDYIRPANVAHIDYKGEPVWGKAYFVPCPALLQDYIYRTNPIDRENHFRKAIALLVAANLIGRAFDVIDVSAQFSLTIKPLLLKRSIAEIYAWRRMERGLEIFSRLVRAVFRPFFFTRA